RRPNCSDSIPANCRIVNPRILCLLVQPLLAPSGTTLAGLPGTGRRRGSGRGGTTMYVCIDAGHGGSDAGAVGGGTCEKWVTAEVALRAGELLHAAGCLVFLTRIGDRRVTLPQRLHAAQETGAELFLSLHCGLASRPEPRGLTVLYPRGDACSQAWAETVLRAAE